MIDPAPFPMPPAGPRARRSTRGGLRSALLLLALGCRAAPPLAAQLASSASPWPGGEPAPVEVPLDSAPSQTPAQPAPSVERDTRQAPLPDSPQPAPSSAQKDKAASSCNGHPCAAPLANWYLRFENGPQVKPLTPQEKAWLATKNLIDPFNLITVLGEAGISVAADSHSAYGPGMPGYGRYVGVSFTQDITGEFFDTFLIPSIAHQDPHYHRMPHASYLRRAFHTVDAVVWARGDNGKGMLNYATLLGYGIDDEIGNLYVPGQQTDGAATARRYAIGLATTPIDNAISEFLPDVARRIHVQIVVVQRIINQVASKESGGT